MNKTKKTRKKLKGTVVSNKMQNAVKVEVTSLRRHPRYKKVVKTRKVYYARALDKLRVGDEVTIESTRPLSKLIRWKVIEKTNK